MNCLRQRTPIRKCAPQHSLGHCPEIGSPVRQIIQDFLSETRIRRRPLPHAPDAGLVTDGMASPLDSKYVPEKPLCLILTLESASYHAGPFARRSALRFASEFLTHSIKHNRIDAYVIDFILKYKVLLPFPG